MSHDPDGIHGPYLPFTYSSLLIPWCVQDYMEGGPLASVYSEETMLRYRDMQDRNAMDPHAWNLASKCWQAMFLPLQEPAKSNDQVLPQLPAYHIFPCMPCAPTCHGPGAHHASPQIVNCRYMDSCASWMPPYVGHRYHRRIRCREIVPGAPR